MQWTEGVWLQQVALRTEGTFWRIHWTHRIDPDGPRLLPTSPYTLSWPSALSQPPLQGVGFLVVGVLADAYAAGVLESVLSRLLTSVAEDVKTRNFRSFGV